MTRPTRYPGGPMRLTKDDIPNHAPVTIDLPNGMSATVHWEHDPDLGPPWEEHDGHGIVSEWTRRAKRPGEMLLVRDRGASRYYDFAETVKIARRDGWGAEGRTAGERAHKAAMDDFRRMRAWCNNEWQWIRVIVCVHSAGSTTIEESLWGIESDGDYWRDVAAESINGIIAEYSL